MTLWYSAKMQATSLYHRATLRNHTWAFLVLAQRPNRTYTASFFRFLVTHNYTHKPGTHSPERVISSTQRPLPTQHTINTTDEHPYLQCNSNPRFQRSNGFRPTHWNAWPSESGTWTTRRRVFSTSALEDCKWHNSLSDDRSVPLCQGLSGTAVWTILKKNVAAKKQKLSQQNSLFRLKMEKESSLETLAH